MRSPEGSAAPTMTIAEMIDSLVRGGMPMRFTAYDGSAAGPADADRSACTCATSAACATCSPPPATSAWPAPTSPATSSVTGVHPGDPYDGDVGDEGAHASSGCRRPPRRCG